MALITDLMQTYDQSSGNDYTIAEGIHMISPTDTPLQLLLPKIQVGAVKAEWIEDELTGQATTLAATVADTTTTQITALHLYPSDVANTSSHRSCRHHVVRARLCVAAGAN